MKMLKLALVVSSSCFAHAGLACENPPLPMIPAADEIGDRGPEIQAAMQRYVEGMFAYVECIQAELVAAGGEDAPERQRTLLIQRNNQAVAEADAMSTLYSQRLGATPDAEGAE